MLTTMATVQTREREIGDLVDAVARSTRSLDKKPEPRWHHTDFGRRGSADRLHRLVTGPADEQVPIDEAMSLPIALASLVLARYGPAVPNLPDVMHDETTAQAAADITQSIVRNYPSDVAIRRMVSATMLHRARLDRVIHSGVWALGTGRAA